MIISRIIPGMEEALDCVYVCQKVSILKVTISSNI